MEIDRRREVRGVAEAAGFAFDAHDLAVKTFGNTIGDRVLGEVINISIGPFSVSGLLM